MKRKRRLGAPASCASTGAVTDKTVREPEVQTALLQLQGGLDSARRLIERTRSLLAGEASYNDAELAMSAAQAAAGTSEIIQNPAAE